MEWLKRHRRKFFWAGAVSGGIIIAGKIAEAKFKQWQEQEASSFMERAKKQHHFERTERTGQITLQSLFPSLTAEITGCLDSDAIHRRLASDEDLRKEEKLRLWTELKALSFARAGAYLIGGLHLALLLKGMISILGGYLYQKETASEQDTGLSQRVQEGFLSVCSEYVSEEVPELCQRMRAKCQERLGGVSLKEKLSLVDVEGILRDVVASEVKVNSGRLLRIGAVDWKEFSDEDARERDLLRRLFADAMDIVENEDFQRLLTACLPVGLSILLDQLAEGVNSKHFDDQDDPRMVNLNEVRLPLAKFIPMLSGLVQVRLGERPDPLLMALSRLDGITAFSANVYEVFSHPREEENNNGRAVQGVLDVQGVKRFMQSFWG